MAYSLDALQDGCYENTTVPINKFDIRDEKTLNALEQEITGGLLARAITDIPFTNVNFDFYKNLHRYVFSDLYAWAGELRTVNMSKKGTVFCDFKQLEEYGARIFTSLAQRNYLKDCPEDLFLEEFTELYCNLNFLHPFREGNGRIQRLFLTLLLKNTGKALHFADIDKDLFMIATIKSASGDVFMLKEIFRTHITSL